MLGALFSSAASNSRNSSHPSIPSAKPIIALESVQEENHTRNLLFPVLSQLHQSYHQAFPLPEDASGPSPASLSAFDNHGELELDSLRDVRVIIAQDATSQQAKVVLFDSRAATAGGDGSPDGSKSARKSPTGIGPGLGPKPMPPRSSLRSGLFARAPDPFTQPPEGPPLGAFDRCRRRDSQASAGLDISQRSAPADPPGGTRLLLDCMFGSAPLSYRGDTTKLHVFPVERRPVSRSATTSPTTSESLDSFGRAEGRRRSQLAQSFTPNDVRTFPASSSVASTHDIRSAGSRTVLVTRTFSLDVPDEANRGRDGKVASPPSTDAAAIASPPGYPFPSMEDRLRPTKRTRPTLRKSPVYAIALVLQLPLATGSGETTVPRSRPRAPSSNSDADATSYNPDRPSGWTFFTPSQGLESLSGPLLQGSDVDDRLDLLVERWDIISRVLGSIQTAVKAPMTELLRHAAVLSPLPSPSSAASLPRTTVEVGTETVVLDGRARVKPPKISMQIIHLNTGALAGDTAVKQKVEAASARLVDGLRLPRVVTGQGRWGMWREEARWVGRWCGRKEQQFFFFNLLTAFLGHHTEWLSALGPTWYRQRHLEQHKSHATDDLSIPNRTVISAPDKMAARRLIFLLSAFLPASRLTLDAAGGIVAMATSGKSYSQSLPSTSLSREPSLRRTMNKRTGNAPVKRSRAAPRDPGSTSILETSHGLSAATDGERGLDPGQFRRSSDTPSLTASGLSISQGNSGTRKGSAATTTTITPASTVPYFSVLQADQVGGTAAEPRPGSSGSLASLNLMHTLRRNQSTDQSNTSTDSQSTSRWGSLISGFWSNRRDSSAAESETTVPPEDANPPSGFPQPRTAETTSRHGQLARMVRQVQPANGRSDGELYQEDFEDEEMPRVTATTTTTATGSLPQPLPKSPPKDIGTFDGQAIPPRSQPMPAPFKLSIDEQDGVIDVDIPLPGFLSSANGSPSTSPSTAGFLSVASLDGPHSSGSAFLSARAFASVEADLPVNVAGFLPRYHPDFALQAVRPYDELEADLKRSMRAEPTPSLAAPEPSVGTGTDERWVEVCTALIADTQAFSVRRLRLRRRVQAGASASTPTASTPSRAEADERFVSEVIFDMDGTLIDAVERIIAHSQPSSKSHSTTSSHHQGQGVAAADPSEAVVEVPRRDCQKMVLGALEQVVKSVATERRDDEARPHATDSTLREGVRKWLSDVEDLN
ncbi:MAG: hypothetical protein M1838_001764 [Thelocarpon superellum]|nr:MAG: hypothetical protein M1838_001764 [Thelocarpon superellum]